MATGNTVLDNDGKSVPVDLLYSVDKGDLIVADGWIGLADNDGTSGETISLNVDRRAYQIELPSGLSCAKGDTIFIDVTDLTGHRPDSSAYSITSGSNKVAMFRLIEGKDSNNVAIGLMLGAWAS